VQIYQGTSAAGKLVYQLSGSKTVRNEELNVTMNPSNYGTATKPQGYRKSQNGPKRFGRAPHRSVPVCLSAPSLQACTSSLRPIVEPSISKASTPHTM
jgi:hypothetical protein